MEIVYCHQARDNWHVFGGEDHTGGAVAERGADALKKVKSPIGQLYPGSNDLIVLMYGGKYHSKVFVIELVYVVKMKPEEYNNAY